MTHDLTRLVLLILGLSLFVALIGVVVLAALGRPIHDILPLVISNVIVGTLGILTPRSGTQDVNVVNERHEAVPVDPH